MAMACSFAFMAVTRLNVIEEKQAITKILSTATAMTASANVNPPCATLRDVRKRRFMLPASKQRECRALVAQDLCLAAAHRVPSWGKGNLKSPKVGHSCSPEPAPVHLETN